MFQLLNVHLETVQKYTEV